MSIMELPEGPLLKPPPPTIGDDGYQFTAVWEWRGGQNGTPIRDFDWQERQQHTAARLRMATGSAPISKETSDWQDQILRSLNGYIPRDAPIIGRERLYVTDFQGPGHGAQYVKAGHSNNIVSRLEEHLRAANAHGWGMVNAWISPILANSKGARTVERKMLNALAEAHSGSSAGERFYGMDFVTAVAIAWENFNRSREHWMWQATVPTSASS